MSNTNPARPKMMDAITAAADVGYPHWNPTEHPYRLSLARSSYCGELHTTAVFATEAEALAALEMLMPKGSLYATVCLAINTHDWCERGRWQRIARRVPAKATTFAKRAA